jgi:hypothetical protein
MGADGALTVVTVTKSGSSSATVTPAGAFDTPLYVLFAYYGVTHDGATCDVIPARKADGALYCISLDCDSCAFDGELDTYWSMIQADQTGDLIWIDHAGQLTRVDMTDPAHPAQTGKCQRV